VPLCPEDPDEETQGEDEEAELDAPADGDMDEELEDANHTIHEQHHLSKGTQRP